ncbi:TonB-dependent siderophore receptor [Pseudomaricurvus alkylphenolicus]|uniref:TonB-dependent receptor n=1 Tax=Pseudomaricurvus alkylphenolicus TaxID=1306991 RepID=UPI001423B218|nr:TonB-dependent siderophore receptor [Pseudomaricurvus alkylphenolicus]NIB41452.1 TonB-dependent siderophore receptor [Pseudomaricurvus alkylphenolicus]
MHKKNVVLLSTVLSSALLANAVAAENARYSEEVQIEGQHLSMDKVNSVKAPTPIIDIPQSLSIFSAAQIEQQGIKSLRGIVDYTVGVNTSQGEGHRDSVVFRGVRSTADFFIDGVRDDVQYYRPLYNVEQVEILRGPNALLFGRGGTGGVLNRVSKKGQIGEDFTDYKASVDTHGEYEVQVDSNVAISENVAFRLNAYYGDLENHRDFFDGDQYGINPTLRIQLSPETTLDLFYEYVDHERFVDRGIPTGADGRPVDALDDIVFGDAKLNKTDITAHVFRAALQHEFSESLKGTFSAFHGDYEKSYQNFYASAYNEANSPDEVTLDGYLDTTDRQNTILSANLIKEFTTGGMEHTLLFGGEYIDTSSDQDRYNAVWTPDSNNDSDTEIFPISSRIISGGTAVNTSGVVTGNSFATDLNDDTRVDIEVQSLYIQDQIKVTPWMDIVLGARFDSFEIDVFNVKTDERRSRKDEEVSPRAGVIIKPMDNLSIYASYSESFLPRSGEQYANINGDNDKLDPDTFESTEIGVKWDITSTLSLTTAYFENEQTRADRDNDTGEQFEVRGLEVEGFEIQVQGQINDRLYFTGGYSYLEGETGSGQEPRELPENMAFLWSNYEFTDRFGAGIGITYQDESLISDGSLQKLPSYTRVDVAAYYDLSEKVRLQLNIENLTDEDYYPNAHSKHQVTVGAPLTALFSVNGSF